jgi:protein gp37
MFASVAANRDYGLPRIQHLQEAEPSVPFLSIEPLLEDVGWINLSGIAWVIVGGESGPGARPMNPRWVLSIQRQCRAAGVAFFFK